MATADELVTILGVEVSSETMHNLSSFKAGISGAVDKLNSLALVAGGFMVAAGFMIKGVMDNASALELMSEKSGLSTDALQEWQYAAEKTGVSAQAIQGDLISLNKTMASPIPGQYNVNFAMLGVSVRDANGALKSSDDLLGDVAGKMSEMSHQKAMQWGSKLGISDDTVILLRQGKEGLEALKKEAHEVGAIIPSEALKRSEEFRKSLVTMQSALRGITSTIAIAAMPALQRMVETFTGWIQENRRWIAMNTEAFMQGFVNAVERIYKAFQRVLQYFSPIIDKFKELVLNVDRTEQFTHLLTGAILALGIIFSPFLAKLALVSAAFTLISYAVEDVFTFMEGGDSVVGRLADAFGAAFPQWAALLKTIAGLAKDLFLGSLEVGWNILKKLGAAALEVFGALGNSINDVAGPLNEFITTFGERFPAIVDAVKLLASIITGTLGFALEAVVGLLKVVMSVAADVFKFLLEKITAAVGKLNDFLSWMGLGGGKDKDAKSQEKSSKSDATSYAPAPQLAAVHGALDKNTVVNSSSQKAPPSAAGASVSNSDNRTINQQIYTNDPQQAANLSLQGMGASPQINTAGLYAPVVR